MAPGSIGRMIGQRVGLPEPKTYNSRQLAQLRVEAAYAPQLPDGGHDATRHIRYFSIDEITALIDHTMARVAADKPTHLKPDTAYLIGKAPRMWIGRAAT